jgi:predicted GIY-YIG superfamily endonuclease
LVYFEVLNSRSEAIKREKAIKNQKSKKIIEQLIAAWHNSWHIITI